MVDFNEEFNELSSGSVLDHHIIKQVYYSKMNEFYKYPGLKKSPVQVMGSVIRFIFTTNSAIWFEKDLIEELADYQPKLPVEIDITSTRQTIKWLKIQEQAWVVHPKEIATALKYNHCWPSVRSNGKIIGCIKIGFGNVYIVDYNRMIEFPERMAFIYDTYVLQEERGKGIAKYLIAQAIKFLKAQGYTKVRCHIPAWNKTSISAYEKIGFRKVSYIRYFKIFGIPIRKVKPVNENSNV
jgi:ribosomal protein S18 acetylase RimI-like enzyme